MQRQRRLLAIAALAGLAMASAAAPAGAQPAPFNEDAPDYRSNKPYQSEVEREQRRQDEESGKLADESPLSVTGGVDFRDHYFFRGYNYVDPGLMGQPYVVVGYTVYETEKLAVTPHAGAWFNFTEDQGPNPPTHFSEFRGDGGV